eukprot:3356003-Prymnesium_polylepis.1
MATRPRRVEDAGRSAVLHTASKHSEGTEKRQNRLYGFTAESEKRDRNVVRRTCACFERRQLVLLVRHVAGIILRPFREQKCRRV